MPTDTPSAKKPRIGSEGPEVAVFVGEEGSFAHKAAVCFFKDRPSEKLQGVVSANHGLELVLSGKAKHAVIPIENSSAGPFEAVYDLLVKYNNDLEICGEYGVQDVFCLAARRPDVEIKTIKRIVTHPMIHESCSTFIREHLPSARGQNGAEFLELVSTKTSSEATTRVAQAEEYNDSHTAAITTKEAALRHNLRILKEDIGNEAYIETRYILVRKRNDLSHPPLPHDARTPVRKCSMCFALLNEAGAIFKLFACFAMRNIDIIKVKTRPVGGGARAPAGFPKDNARLWDYLFFVDYCVPALQTEEAHAQLMASLSEFTIWKANLGTYMSQTSRGKPKEPQSFQETVDLIHFG
eukprot:TRINITY_DN13342_c0_g1_i1.p1 TRINITY_DN13342_c0_g1~~TRINITY_DN13342_c0_g1_i1.p1  ORF type:complete len:374 (-),score=56.46 TRINITY_DN13342_c0_g1_i1:66-1124(-)